MRFAANRAPTTQPNQLITLEPQFDDVTLLPECELILFTTKILAP